MSADNVDINAAIAAAGAGKMELSEGDFTVVAQITPVSGVTIEGQGNSTKITMPNAGDAIDAFFEDATAGTATDWAIKNLQIDGNKANVTTSCRGITVWGSHVLIENVWVHDINGQDGIVVSATANLVNVVGCYVKDVDDMGIEVIDGATDVTVRGCTVDGALGAANFSIHSHTGTAAVTRARFIDCHSLNATGRSYRISGFTGLESVNCSIINCDDFNPGTGLYVDLSNDSLVSGCSLTSRITSAATATRLRIVSCSMSGDCNSYGSYATWQNCVINGGVLSVLGDHSSVIGLTHNGTNAVNNFGLAIFTPGHYSSVSGCVLYGEDAGARYGIWLRGAQNCTVDGNVVEGWTGSGIRLNTQTAVNPTGNVVSGNRAEGCGIGISEEASGDNNFITGNDVTGNTTPLAKVGASTIVRNNKGWVTENSGTGSIASGATAATITHGLSVTPTVDDIMVTLAENPTNTPGAIWVDTITSTQFNVNCENDPGASNLDFGWRAVVL